VKDHDGDTMVYVPVSFRFRMPSEHALNGTHYDVEMQIMHKAYSMTTGEVYGITEPAAEEEVETVPAPPVDPVEDEEEEVENVIDEVNEDLDDDEEDLEDVLDPLRRMLSSHEEEEEEEEVIPELPHTDFKTLYMSIFFNRPEQIEEADGGDDDGDDSADVVTPEETK